MCVVAQPVKPINGPANPVNQVFALTNATVFTDYKTKVENATIIIIDGKINKVGVGISIPVNASVISCKGKFIYPGFIDLYSDYGVTYKPERREVSEPRLTSSKPGAWSWNEAVHPEVNAAENFKLDENRAKVYRDAGFSAVLTSLHDGIFRGDAAIVSTSSGDEKNLIIAEKVVSGISFSKGSSTQPYPSSLTGVIALIRQSYYDAQWFKQHPEEVNYSLKALVDQMKRPAIFAVENKLDILRAKKIADEFKLNFIVKGNGDEYQRLNEIKSTGLPLILPLNFPKPFDLDNPYNAERVNTADLKHWEIAPSNPALVAQSGIQFAFTMKGCEQPDEFLKQLRKAVSHGLSTENALKALTGTPAQLIGMDKLLGVVAPGAIANLVISNGNIFDKQYLILETWSQGKRYVIRNLSEDVIAGDYKIDSRNYTLIRIKGNEPELQISLLGKDTLKGTFKSESGIYYATFQKSGKPATLSMWPLTKVESKVSSIQINAFDSTLFDPGIFNAIRQNDAKPDTSSKKEKNINIQAKVTYPFTDFGWTDKPISEKVMFKNATIWTNEADSILYNTDLIIDNGKIVSIGKNLTCSPCKVIDATGKFLTSGIIDEHSHIALTRGVNEGTQSVTAEVRMGDVINSEDINIYRQLSGGVTASQLLHGSANPIGGQSAMIKLRWGLAPEQMKIEGADGFIKFALGENVKQSNWGDRAIYRYPQTRMGVEQIDIDAFTRAREYEKNNSGYRDLELETLLEILNKKRFITCHSYVQSEINMLMHVADSFGFRINTFTHILEGYKVADKMKRHGVGASTFADWWAYKYEVMEAIPYNASILNKMGIVTAINSDDAEMGRRLNQEAAKSVRYGGTSEMDAWKMVTLNPAKLLHLDNRMGSIKVGKDADVVLWSDNPLSIYAKAEYTFVDGVCYYDLNKMNLMTTEIQKERKRLIQKMIEEKASGEKTEKKINENAEEYHCDTEGDYGK